MNKELFEQLPEELMEEVREDFGTMWEIANIFATTFNTEDCNELDRLTVELLKVVELKKIASILAEKE